MNINLRFINFQIFLLVCFLSCKDNCENFICENEGNAVVLASECTCNCLTGYTGANCELFDVQNIQALLDTKNHSPMELYNAGIPIEDLIGKNYLDGVIFYLDVLMEYPEFNGLLAASSDEAGNSIWYCPYNSPDNIPYVGGCPGDCVQPLDEETTQGARIGDGVSNTDLILASFDIHCQQYSETTIAAKACRSKGEEWFLPSRGELNLMYTNLHLNGLSDFEIQQGISTYWSSSRGPIGQAYYDDPSTFYNASWCQRFTDGMLVNCTVGGEQRVRAIRYF